MYFGEVVAAHHVSGVSAGVGCLTVALRPAELCCQNLLCPEGEVILYRNPLSTHKSPLVVADVSTENDMENTQIHSSPDSRGRSSLFSIHHFLSAKTSKCCSCLMICFAEFFLAVLYNIVFDLIEVFATNAKSNTTLLSTE